MARLTLNEHLFEVLEDLTDKSIQGKELDDRIRRADAVTKISQQIIANGNLGLKAVLAAIDRGKDGEQVKKQVKLLTGGE
jgi:hypothetical protein